MAREFVLFFRVTNRWQSDSYNVSLWGVLRVEASIGVYWKKYKNIAVNASFLHMSHAWGFVLWLRRYHISVRLYSYH